MFLHRESELKDLRKLLAKPSHRCKAAIVYGKRRVGKSLLIKEALKDYSGIAINFLASDQTYELNVRELASTVAEASPLLAHIASTSELPDILRGLAASGQEIALVLDEYPYLKESYKDGNLDSVFLREMEKIDGKITIIFCGSYIFSMEEMLSHGKPLYGRFDTRLDLKCFNYLEAADFYPDLEPAEKIRWYAVFGGYPFALDVLDTSASLEENIKNLILNPRDYVHIILRKILLEEIKKASTAEAMLRAMGNGKLRNSELASATNLSTSLVASNTKRLIKMDLVQQVSPINRNEDGNKIFYEIKDNLLRFYYTFVFPNLSRIETLGIESVWRNRIEGNLEQFIAHRYEAMTREYYAERARRGIDLDTDDVGSYWYDIPPRNGQKGRNGEFDCAIRTIDGGYKIVECKYLKDPMKESLAKEEEAKIEGIPSFSAAAIGFASARGFDFTSDRWELVDAAAMYNLP